MLAALLAGCQTMLELDPPELSPDAGVAVAAPDAVRTASPDAPSCPPAPAGCTLFQCAATSGCYYACEVAATWSVAQDICAQVGCLATVDSTADQECIAAATAPTNASPVWIGAYQPDTAAEPNKGWTWACGASTYGNWGNFEPNDLAGDQDCGEMAAGGYWNDVSCGVQRRFVCKAP